MTDSVQQYTRVPLAFYAPLKPPTHPNPSGDRQLARLLMQALDLAGFEVELAARLRSRDGAGDPARQRRLRDVGQRLADRLIRRYLARPAELRPRLWFTYHLYHKAPDWLGPTVSRALGIPYVVAEASYAPKREGGPWQLGLAASQDALAQAAAVLCLNPSDVGGLRPWVAPGTLHALAPFVDLGAYDLLPGEERATLAQRYGLGTDRPWLICVAMMRPGDKAHSYRLLAESLRRCRSDDWQLLVVGDGRAGDRVRALFNGLPRVHFLGALPREALFPLLRCADLYLWPAVNEAFGLALIEAQAAGTPVLAGDEGGVASILAPGASQLAPPRDSEAFARLLDELIGQPKRLEAMGRAARDYVHTRHSLSAAADRLRDLLEPLL